MALRKVTMPFCDYHDEDVPADGDPLFVAIDGIDYKIDACADCKAGIKHDLITLGTVEVLNKHKNGTTGMRRPSARQLRHSSSNGSSKHRKRRSPPPAGAAARGLDNKIVRGWAGTKPEFKHIAHKRGKLPEEVLDAYQEAHPNVVHV
jgi:hypothetical protein